MSCILLIDDDTDMLAMTVRWLEKAGHRVLKAASGKEALSILEDASEEKPELILLDYAMPEMDGPAVLRAIRALEGAGDIPILYRTGVDDMDAMEAGDAKACGFVSKSEGRPALINAVTKALAGA